MKYKRHPQSFYLSSLEVIFASVIQNQNPTPSKASFTGKFGSRMVTAVLTGTEEGGIDIAAYQVSEQACAMADADMIEASVDPGIVRVKEEDRGADTARYVPDVFFRYKNEYGLDVQKNAKPCFPVEYLLVNVRRNTYAVSLPDANRWRRRYLTDSLRVPRPSSDPSITRSRTGPAWRTRASRMRSRSSRN